MQTAGRAARNKDGRVILYADSITPGMQALIDQTEARRRRQIAYNEAHGITPQTIRKERHFTIGEIVSPEASKGKKKMPSLAGSMITDSTDLGGLGLSPADQQALIEELTGEMLRAAEALEFERAADLRDRIRSLSSGK